MKTRYGLMGLASRLTVEIFWRRACRRGATESVTVPSRNKKTLLDRVCGA